MLVDTARPGIVLLCAGIAGRFVLPDTAEPQQLCFFAAGIGITPVYSILQALLRHTAHSAVLIYSNHDLESTVFYKELNELEAGYSNRLRIVWLFATDYNLQQARLNKALVHKLLKELNIGPECMHYICGPEAYMRMVTLALEEAGVTAGQVLRAHFVTGLTGPPVALSLLPPDTLPHTVTLHRRLQTVKLHCKYPETLLQAALSQGIAIPYSCRTGLCGSCVVQVITGHIWMGANDVLTPADIASGLALSCTGYPIGGDATVVVK
jgi:ring-1,2-phenylacetyl-CoA epoxidase subunit PaaE